VREAVTGQELHHCATQNVPKISLLRSTALPVMGLVAFSVTRNSAAQILNRDNRDE